MSLSYSQQLATGHISKTAKLNFNVQTCISFILDLFYYHKGQGRVIRIIFLVLTNVQITTVHLSQKCDSMFYRVLTQSKLITALL
jgi:hypothetical protein